MGFAKHDIKRDEWMLTGKFARQGYDWWWHSFTGRDEQTGEEKPFFIEFFTCNPALAEDEPVFGQLPENKEAGKKPSYLMVKAGAWGEGKAQLHRFFAYKDVVMRGKMPYSIQAGDCYASETVLKGSINISKEEAQAHPEWMCDSGSMSWELLLDKQIPFNVGYGASTPLRKMHAFEMYWHAEGMKTLFSGTVVFNGRKYIVERETSYGYSDKNWGANFTSPWVWLSSCNLTSKLTGEKLENSAFDIGGGKPKIFFVSLDRKLLAALYREGKCYEFNFSKFWTVTRTEFESKETEDKILWYVRQETVRFVMVTEVSCLKKDMLWVNYEAPTGEKRHNRLWNGGNGTGTVKLYRKTKYGLKLIDELIAENIGCEYGEFDR